MFSKEHTHILALCPCWKRTYATRVIFNVSINWGNTDGVPTREILPYVPGIEHWTTWGTAVRLGGWRERNNVKTCGNKVRERSWTLQFTQAMFIPTVMGRRCRTDWCGQTTVCTASLWLRIEKWLEKNKEEKGSLGGLSASPGERWKWMGAGAGKKWSDSRSIWR